MARAGLTHNYYYLPQKCLYLIDEIRKPFAGYSYNNGGVVADEFSFFYSRIANYEKNDFSKPNLPTITVSKMSRDEVKYQIGVFDDIIRDIALIALDIIAPGAGTAINLVVNSYKNAKDIYSLLQLIREVLKGEVKNSTLADAIISAGNIAITNIHPSIDLLFSTLAGEVKLGENILKPGDVHVKIDLETNENERTGNRMTFDAFYDPDSGALKDTKVFELTS